MLFSEPKIPQSGRRFPTPRALRACFSALQRAENSSIIRARTEKSPICSFSALQRAENSSMQQRRVSRRCRRVSVLFSEPKIPQFGGECAGIRHQQRVSVLFSEPKIPQSDRERRSGNGRGGFSALQRAENSSIEVPHAPRRRQKTFQCSSASRKFLNGSFGDAAVSGSIVSVLFSEPKIPQFGGNARAGGIALGFSALQRAENSSIRRGRAVLAGTPKVSVLFSEPKIPQFSKRISSISPVSVSVLFSEPKIPQYAATADRPPAPGAFQCSSASRKFLNRANETRSAVRS